MVAYTQNGRDGNWTDLNIGSANATVYKRTRESSITLTADSISTKGTLTLANNVNVDVGEYFYAFGNIFLSTNIQATDVKGTLFFKKISDLSKGKYASYNNDRIVFYENDYTGKDFVAYVCFSLSRILHCLNFALTSFPLRDLVHS